MAASLDEYRSTLAAALGALAEEGRLNVDAFNALLPPLVERSALRRDADRERQLVSLQQVTIDVVRRLHLSRPLQEYRDRYEFALRDALRDASASADEVTAFAASLGRERYLPQGELEALLAVGCSGWYALRSSALPPGRPTLAELPEITTRAELLRFLEEEYFTDTWGALVFRRPDLVAPLAGAEPGPFLSALVGRDFRERQFPAIERQLQAELEGREENRGR